MTMNTVEFALPKEATSADLSGIKYIAGGSFGNVIKVPQYVCRDGKQICVAIKKLYEPFRDVKNAQRVFREIKLLQMMIHENIVKLVDLYTPDTSPSSLQNVYIVSEYAGRSLSEILEWQKEMGIVRLTPPHNKFIIYQLLRALKYIHSAGVIHRDLKPGNLALTADCDLSVLDFGQARTLNNDDTPLSAYVMTRWYRSPEVIYWKVDSYDTQADMWSVGCILAELSLGRPLFPGDDSMAQYRLITELCGSPDKDLLAKLSHNEAIVNVIKHLGEYKRKNFMEYFGNSFSPDLIKFLDKILVLDPEKRMTVQEALEDAYLRDYHAPDDEPVASEAFVINECNDHQKTLQQWKRNFI
ncbi:unnamed protein product [Anisakis simplex]|uniref:Protein kinase domain-containing protein n=1 Tax=Anisakis simplex TaxID=6269 RepID=A0A3P6S461_ANISI|nr:unnamed protein product [Anisakis simplex]